MKRKFLLSPIIATAALTSFAVSALMAVMYLVYTGGHNPAATAGVVVLQIVLPGVFAVWGLTMLSEIVITEEGVFKRFLGRCIRSFTWEELYEIGVIYGRVGGYMFFSKAPIVGRGKRGWILEKYRARKDNIWIFPTEKVLSAVRVHAPQNLLPIREHK